MASTESHDNASKAAEAPHDAAPPRTNDNTFRSQEGGSRSSVPQSNIVNDPVSRSTTDNTVHTLPIDIARNNRDSPHISGQELDRSSSYLSSNPFSPPPSVHLAEDPSSLQRRATKDTHRSRTTRELLTVIPKQATLASRLAPTIQHAQDARERFAKKAKLHGYALNTAIGLQVLLGSLTTGLSAAATSGKSAAVQTTILGGLATIVASYMARARGSNEPELSNLRVKDLDQFIRDCQALSMDHGHDITGRFDDELKAKRKRFEELLGNASGERKLSPV